MSKKIKNLMVVIAAMFALSAPALVPVAAHAAPADNAINDGLCEGLNTATGGTTDSCTDAPDEGTGSLQGIIKTIINIFSLVVGFVSVIMIILGGFKYITSGGESSNVSGAKNTIMYAIIGLIIVALAQVIVRFVLTQATQA